MGKGPAKAAAAGMPAITAPRGTKEYRQQIAARGEWVDNYAKYNGGWQALEDLGIANEEGMARGVYRTYGPGGYFSTYGGNYNTNFIYDWGTGRKLNIATNAEAFPGEAVQNSQGQWVFDPSKASAERWEAITPEEYQGYQEQQQWNAQNPGMTYADRIAQLGMQENIRRGHFTKDPRSGNFYNIRPDGSVEWKDKYGRPLSGPQGGVRGYGGGGGGNFVSSYSSGGGGGFSPWGGGGGVSGGPAGYSPMPAGPAGGGGYGYGQGWAPGGGTDYGGIFAPYLGSEAQLNQIMMQGAMMDNADQNYQLQKGANYAAKGQPVNNFLQDFWGSILGVGWDPVDPSNISDYYNSAAATQVPGVGYTPGAPAPGGGGIPPKYPGNPYPPTGPHGSNPTWPDPSTGGIGGPNGVIPGKPWVDPLQGEEGNGIPQGGIGGQPGVAGGASSYKVSDPGVQASSSGGPIYEEPPEGMTPEEYKNAQGGFPGGEPPWYTQWVQSGGAPWQYGGGWPGQPGYGGTMNVPPMAQLPPLPPLPNMGISMQGGYHALAGGPNEANAMSLMSLPIQQLSADSNAEIERLRRELPEGGERDRAIAEATRGAYGTKANMRLGLVQDALGNLDKLQSENRFNVPMAPYQGSAGNLMNAYTNRYATDVGAASSRYAADLGARTSRYATDKNYQLGLQQLRNQNNPWNSFMGVLGGLGGSLLGNPGLF